MVRLRFPWRFVPALCLIVVFRAGGAFAVVQPAELAGYLLVAADRVPTNYHAGFSVYAAAWPLLRTYPGHRFQSGLFGTWMHAQFDGPKPAGLYSDIEGGLGWWRDTRFPTVTPKFIMGGVAANFSRIANGPGYGRGTWEEPRGLYGVAQLSPWLLFPLDGLNLKPGTCGEWLGYGYLPLPLSAPAGDQWWTLFLNTRMFKGPVACFTPGFWSEPAATNAALAGLLLDTRPSDPNKAFQMETQYVPAAMSVDARGETFARIAPTVFPLGTDGVSRVLHRPTSYARAALWDGVKAWFEGGAPVSGVVDTNGAWVQTVRSQGGSTWRIHLPRAPKEAKVPIEWRRFASAVAPDSVTYGYEWNNAWVAREGDRVTLPEYFRLVTNSGPARWVVVAPADVPPETGLAAHRFEPPPETPQLPRVTPDAPDSPYRRPGPVAGPFQAHLGDGSVVTYHWYRFADQPAMVASGLTAAERERLQGRVERLHRAWPRTRDYLAPPTVGGLAELDPALVVTPPKGMEYGYVPIATRQELRGGGRRKE